MHNTTKQPKPFLNVSLWNPLLIILVLFSLSSCLHDPNANQFLKPENKQDEHEEFSINTDDTFVIVDDMPEFIGGEKMMLEYLYTNINYPIEAQEKKVEGLCVVSFIVMKDGSIEAVTIRRDIGSGCGEEAARVVKSMPNWKPGRMKGELVKVSFNLPVRFKL